MDETADVLQRVEGALEKIRTAIQLHGGDVHVVDVDLPAKVLYVRLTGACIGCAASILTLKIGVERAIAKQVPEIERVEAVD